MALLLEKTSETHPLHIAEIGTKLFGGRIGLSLCPGKKQAAGLTGAWSRDLGRDLDVIRDAGYAVVVTLIERHEMDAMGVADIASQVAARHMDWVHLPIRDASVPDARFDREWDTIGEGLRARLRDGFSMFVHCKGGLGRAGTIAARLLVELGVAPRDAIAQVREARPGAIETRAQEDQSLAAARSRPCNRHMLPQRRPIARWARCSAWRSATRSAPRSNLPRVTASHGSTT